MVNCICPCYDLTQTLNISVKSVIQCCPSQVPVIRIQKQVWSFVHWCSMSYLGRLHTIFYSIDFFKLLLWTDNDLLVSEILNFFICIFFYIFSQYVENRQRKRPIERKIGFTKQPRSLNPCKVKAMTICHIIVHFTT